MKLWVNKQGTVIPARADGSAFLCGLCALCGESFLRGSIFATSGCACACEAYNARHVASAPPGAIGPFFLDQRGVGQVSVLLRSSKYGEHSYVY